MISGIGIQMTEKWSHIKKLLTTSQSLLTWKCSWQNTNSYAKSIENIDRHVHVTAMLKVEYFNTYHQTRWKYIPFMTLLFNVNFTYWRF